MPEQTWEEFAKAHPELDIRHLSSSSINDLQVCERRWAYARGIDPTVAPAPPNAYLVLGQSVHAMIEAYLNHDDVLSAQLKVEQEARDLGGDVDLSRAHASKLWAAWHEWHRATNEYPTSVEGEKMFLVAGHPFKAFIDAIYSNIGRDWKTARKPWDDRKASDCWVQATTYYFATGLREWEFIVLHYQDAKYRTKTGYQVVKYRVTDADIRRLEALVRAYAPLVQSQNIEDYPIRPTSSNWLCRKITKSRPWGCAFYEICPGGGRE